MDIVVTAERHPKIGETVVGSGVVFSPGGKGANQAVAAVKSGASTVLIGRVGSDAFGGELLTFYAEQGVDLSHVKHSGSPTGTALIVSAARDNSIVVVAGCKCRPCPR